jgi:predicted dinucleotide-binding enzyme
MKIGIVGAGNVGLSLGKALLKAGHEVMFSSRDPRGEHARKIKEETGAPVGTVSEVLAYSPVIAIALAPDAIEQTIREHTDWWKDKIILDLNNRFAGAATAKSLAEDIAHWTGARVIKIFNTLGAEHYQNPVFEGQKASMFVAGDDSEGKQIAMRLAADIGFEPIDCGGLDSAGMIEKLAQLWVHLALRMGMGRNIAFKLIQRPTQ